MLKLTSSFALVLAVVAGFTRSAAGQCPAAAWTGVGGAPDLGVEALAHYNGELIACGVFTNIDGIPANRIARWNGVSWQPLGSGIGGPSVPQVRCLTVYNGELIAGGQFQTRKTALRTR